MAFLLGAFGSFFNPSLFKNLSGIAQQNSQEGVFQSLSIDQGVIFSGYKLNELYHYDDVISLEDGQGLFVGKLFDWDDYLQISNFTSEDTKLFISNPKDIVKKCWGRYVGVLFDQQNKILTLVRDPQGLSTIFYIERSDGIIFSTDLRFLYEVLECQPSIDLTYFVEHIVNRNYALPLTPFQEVKELLPGLGLKISWCGNKSFDLLWDVSNLRYSFIPDERAFEEELLVVLRKSVKAWVSGAPGVCLNLSGGTDSSGLALLLNDVLPKDKKIIGINFIDSKNNSSNEVEYAQDVANICNMPLHFIDWQNTSLLDKIPQNWYPNRPSTMMLFYNYQYAVQSVMFGNNCPILMNGQGGDQVFNAPHSFLALADYWLERGFRGMSNPLKELCSAYRMPWVPLLRYNLKAVVNYYKGSFSLPNRSVVFFEEGFLKEIKLQDFYFESVLKKFYPAKAEHFEFLYQAVAFAERDQFMHNVVMAHPLLSQPVVEVALKIPVYQSFKDGYDRIFFRSAVSRVKEVKSLWRKHKGQTTSTMVKSFVKQANDVRDILTSGLIVNSGIINENALNKELDKMQHGQIEGLWPILHLLTAQLWIDHWGL